ncbi:acyl-CoA-binding protein [Desulfobacterales bacterium HSG16]|nr:acyl-CoA-binding protein [Desulfobacterales bacterium HSG16]
MSDLKANFEKAAVDVKGLSKKPDNNTLLKLYALYKQGTDGDVSGKRPGLTNIKGRAKFDAWGKEKGKSNDDAMEEYIKLVQSLIS